MTSVNNSSQSLSEQMELNDAEIEQRKRLFNFTPQDAVYLHDCQSFIQDHLIDLSSQFADKQAAIPELAKLVNYTDTYKRMNQAQTQYILELFTGSYGIEYVQNRLRIGIIQKHMGITPKLYLSAILTLKKLLQSTLATMNKDEVVIELTNQALEKLLMFDNSFIFDTYIYALVSEVNLAKQKSLDYAKELEQKVQQRTQQLEALSRTDALTGLLNVRHLQETINTVLKAAKRRNEPVSMVYLDIDDFKQINDTQGHQAGDEVLTTIANILKHCSRAEDCVFRYGGDEFCIILPNCTQKDAEHQFCTRINKAINGYSATLHVSHGLAQTGPKHYCEPSQLLKEADNAMYQNKQTFKKQLLHSITSFNSDAAND